ncbi:MAG: arsenite methyltransferase [Acidobacteria bacterium]|nr:arsenite methyltransferase [Acidobacteriota bacterium]
MAGQATQKELNKEAVHEAVQAAYGAVARTRNVDGKAGQACCGPTCCTEDARPLSDYSPEEISSVPQGAYLGEGSGTPVRHANLQPGGTVVDLGAGAGMDSFLAANKVGANGRVYGFDMTPDMLDRAKRNAAAGNYNNVSFQKADIEHLPLESNTADAAISNCVINLTPDKLAVFREIHRVLKPGGRLSIADIVLRGTPEAISAFREASTTETWCACVSGALDETSYLDAIRKAGFTDVGIVSERPAQIQPGGQLSAVAVTVTGRKSN